MGETESLSVYDFHDGKLERIRAVGANDSMGILYSLVTLHLGFDFNSDEYRIMGLAPYGDPARFRKFFADAVELCPDGSVRIPMLKLNRKPEPTPPKTTSPIMMLMSATMPPSGVSESCMVLTAPQLASVVMVAKSADWLMPLRTSLPSMLPDRAVASA